MKIKLSDLIEDWKLYNINLRNFSENSIKAYSLDLKNFLHFSFQESEDILKSDLSNISSHTIRLWILSLRNKSIKASSTLYISIEGENSARRLITLEDISPYKAKLVEIVKSDSELLEFADQIGRISRIDEGYVEPGEHWDVGNIKFDLVDATGRVGRKQFFTEFIENSEIIFA